MSSSVCNIFLENKTKFDNPVFLCPKSRVYKLDIEYSHTPMEIPPGQTILFINPLMNSDSLAAEAASII